MTLNWIWLLVAFCAGAAIAVGITLAVARPKAGKKSMAELKETHETYRDDVATHFVDTAKLVNEMTDSYKALFDHLQTGAEQLLDESTLREKLTADAQKVITLSRLGHRLNGDASPADVNAAAQADQTAPEEQSEEQTADSAAQPSDSPAETDGDQAESPAAEFESEAGSETATDDGASESEQAADLESSASVQTPPEAEITEVNPVDSAPEDREARTV